MIITRFAPSPTGNFHMGSLRTAIYNYLYSKKYNGKFILRIEDTDKERSKKEYEKEILDIFNLFNLDYDHLSYQSSNEDKHKSYLQKLIDMGLAFKEKDGPYRFKVDRTNKYFQFQDLILGKVKIPSDNIEDFSIARSDGSPTFILSNIIDDYLEGITHVIRGNDHSINTIKQQLILNSLNIPNIKYAHIPLIHDMQGKKLSKRDNITNVKDYIKQGYLTKSIFNFIIKLGNNFNDQEYLDSSSAIDNFELNKTVLSPAKFDLDKLNYINQNYLSQLSYLDFKKHINSKNILLVENLDTKKIYESILERCIKLTDINIELDKLLTFYHSHNQLVLDEEEKNLINKIYKAIQKLHSTDDIIHILNENDLSLKKIGKIIRKIFVNFESKLPIEKIILFYGIGNLKKRLLLYVDD